MDFAKTKAATIDPDLKGNAEHVAFERDAAFNALRFVPMILEQLDDDGRAAFALVAQGMLNAGYADGWRDAEARD